MAKSKRSSIKSAPRDGTKIDLYLHIYASPRSMGMSDSFWVSECWWKDGQWVHQHRGKDEPLYTDYVSGWLPAGDPKPDGDDFHKTEP